jgi:ribosomal-protein-alanine N-acetyltransferase
MPLSAEDLEFYLLAGDIFENKYGLKQTGRMVSKDVRDAVRGSTLPNMRMAGPYFYLYYTFWLVIEKATRTIVAELGFKGKPNDKGEIEIGYGTMYQHRKRGFMTEAVEAMLQWAEEQPEVNWMLAETDESNRGSIRIMEKNGFVEFDKRQNMIWWKKSTQ